MKNKKRYLGAVIGLTMSLFIMGAGVQVYNPTEPVVTSTEVTTAATIEEHTMDLVTSAPLEITEPMEEIQKEEYVYTTTKVNLRLEPSEEGEVLLTVLPNTELYKIEINEEWATIVIEEKEYYIAEQYITTEKPAEIAQDILIQIEDSKIDAKELRYMSAIIFAEAGNQCEAGQQAVGIVVMERVRCENYFEDDVVSVIYEPGQFSPVRNGALNKALARYDNGTLPESCIEAAKYALNGNTIVNYNNTEYDLQGYLFFSRYVKNCRLQIQDHQFK